MYPRLSDFFRDLFGVLWTFRKHPFQAGRLFSLYLVLNAVERFLNKKVRVNPEYHLLGLTPTQAEIISVLLVLGGIVGLVRTWEKEDAGARLSR